MLDRRWAPWVLAAIFVLLLVGPALDPSVQLFYRDTGRFEYHFKQFTTAQMLRGQSPFWDPWTESGTSILGQITPGLFHPFTALYLALPFELAFKLDSLLVVPLALLGAYLLARRAGASAWAATAGGCAYAGCGYVVSVTSSNLPFGLGAATLPLALHGLLVFLDRPRPLRLLWASFALALCVYGGEPQSALLAAGIGTTWALASRPAWRTAGLVAAWGACAVVLALPVALPALPRVLRSTRVSGFGAEDLASYANAPVRLAGVLLPGAFDQTSESVSGGEEPPYSEYFARGAYDEAFADSIVLGAPLLLLAFAAGRRGRWLIVAGAALLLASTGDAFGIQRVLSALPGMKLFRFAEKLVAPGSLLLCVAAALGADTALSPRLARAAAALGIALLGARVALVPLAPRLIVWLQAHGRTHTAAPAIAFTGTLGSALLLEGALLVALAGVALLRERGRPLAALLCASAAIAQSGKLIFTMPTELFHAPILLGDELKARAGPSEDRWRIRADMTRVLVFRKFDLRTARFFGSAQMLSPLLHASHARIESVSEYASLADGDYEAMLQRAPAALDQVMGVRFVVQPSFAMPAAEAERLGYVPAAFGAWVKELPARPRAFLAGCARPAPDRASALSLLASAAFRPGEAVVRKDVQLPCPAPPLGEVRLERPAADRFLAEVDAKARSLLVIAEHFDPGWEATLDGASAEVLQADLSALSVVIPEGRHAVELRYRPPFLLAGVLLALGCALGLILVELLQQDHRVRAAEPE